MDSLEEGEEVEEDKKKKKVKVQKKKGKSSSAQGIMEKELDDDEYPIVS